MNAIQQFDHKKFMQSSLEYSIEDLKLRVLEIYHSEIEIFNRRSVDKLLSHRKKDHKINLTLETKPSFVKNYKSISEQKLATVKKYLDKHLEKRFIRSNSSKTAALMLFMKKPNKGLRFCVNYRKLNKIIEKNRYLISLINEALIKLLKTLIFIKLDVIATFNKIKIKAEQE